LRSFIVEAYALGGDCHDALVLAEADAERLNAQASLNAKSSPLPVIPVTE
jgi:hypothetical protein